MPVINKLLFTFLLSLICLLAKAQISTGELPPSFFNENQAESPIPEILLFKPDVQKQKKIDKVETSNGFPRRFGIAVPVEINMHNSGKWEKISRGISMWRLKLHAEDAVSINLNFNRFKLSQKAKLFFYNEDYSDLLGAITEKNNKENGRFAIRPIQGEVLIMELIVPTEEVGQNKLSIGEYVYGYRDIREKSQKVFNASGACNININCKEGGLWQDVKRSVALITTSNNTRICTGTMVNNVRQDTTPYLLTAAHCGVSNNSIFIFNYESQDCSPTTNGSLNNSISTANQKAIALNSGSDFHLFELSSRPPASYNVYYAGWSAVNEASPKSVSIHHPSGDVKKISTNLDSTATSGFFNSNGSTHWMVRNWEKGTTEQGSSGAPLFDFNHRLIGQLHGGDASCALNAQDYFGKFSASWESDTTAFRQLKAWLDPDDSQLKILDGLDPNPAKLQSDLQLLYIGGIPNYFCGDSIAPFIMVKNLGSDTISSVEIEFKLDTGATQKLMKNISLSRGNLEQIELPSIAVSKGLHRIEVKAFPKTGIADQDSSSNSQSLAFESNSRPLTLDFTLKTDNLGEETIWFVRSPEGIKVAENGPFANITGGQLIKQKLCLYDSCFKFTLIDTQGDGFNIPQFGNGFVLISTSRGDTLLFENNFTSESKIISFCVPNNLTSLNEINLNQADFKVFPNPVHRGAELNLKSSNDQFNQRIEVNLYDLSSRLIHRFTEISENSIRMPQQLAPGIYFLQIKPRPSGIGDAIFKKVIVQ